MSFQTRSVTIWAPNMKRIFLVLFISPIVVGLISFSSTPVKATNLSLGADYLLRGVSVGKRDKNQKDIDYYDSQLSAYLITDLSRDVEATIRVQSITPWGLENSTSALASRYPNANGNLWVQNAFIRLPNIWEERITVIAGRQPIVWGEGAILSDDDLGFNAIRVQIKNPLSAFNWLGPLRKWEFDIDAFSAKINEGLQNAGDTDLHGVKVGYDQPWNAFNESNVIRWDVMSLWEDNQADHTYQVGSSSTTTLAATKVKRQIMGIRAKGTLRDAYIFGEYYRQSGDIFYSNQKIGLKGEAYRFGLGGKANTKKIGRFGAVLEISEGSGDDPGTEGDDEAFRPTYASRWTGLERKGYGRYFAASFSDVYSSTTPFAEVNSINDGLPPGVSGIQTIHFGVESTPWAKWTFSFDYFLYKAIENLGGQKDLGTEFDYALEYRYSGLVTFRGTFNQFRPGESFSIDTKENATLSSFEIDLRF
ncbi:hypothetical protein BVX98_02060 [bacterium F11]|nr:hypothetical protein BVX98_02060 [bacterium F11]